MKVECVGLQLQIQNFCMLTHELSKLHKIKMSQPDIVQQMIDCLEKRKALLSSKAYLGKAERSLTQIFYPACSNLILDYLKTDLKFYQVKNCDFPPYGDIFSSGYSKEEALLKLHNEMLLQNNDTPIY